MDENKKETLEPVEETIEETVSVTQAIEETEITATAAQEETEEEEKEEIAQAAEQPAEQGEQPPKQKKSRKHVVTIIAIAVLAVGVIVGVGVAVHQVRANRESVSATDTGHSEAAQVITGEDATEGAEVANADAIEVIKSYSDESLGVKKADYSFMVAQQAYVIGKEKYVQVIAAEKKENEDGTFSITPVGKYYISFDGKKVLKEDMEKPGTYEKLKK